MPSHPQRLALTATTLCLLTACTPTTPPPTPSPAPSYRCTPETGGDEHDCTQAQHDDMLAKDKLYTQAEAVYRRFFAENERIYRAGGITKPSDTLLATTTGIYLNDSMTVYRSLKKSKTKIVGGKVRLASLIRVPGASKAGSIVALEACIDTSTATIVTAGETPERGFIGVERLYFGRIDHVLKIQSSEWKEVKSC